MIVIVNFSVNFFEGVLVYYIVVCRVFHNSVVSYGLAQLLHLPVDIFPGYSANYLLSCHLVERNVTKPPHIASSHNYVQPS